VNSVANIVQLRQLLAERFPHLRFCSQQSLAKSTAVWPRGLAQLDNTLNGGFPRSAITELTCPKASSGSALLTFALLRQAHESRQWVALVDGMDSFDPARMGEETFRRFLWVRCRNAMQALQASDLLLRDGNLALVILDLRMNPAAELRKVSSTTWHRFQRLIEPAATTLFVITPHPLIPSAHARLELTSRFTLADLDKPEHELLPQLSLRLLRQHSTPNADELLAQAG
jgi:hypothetical protein